MSSTRDQIIETACTLLERQGLHATGLNQLVKESGAPKGSLYYYFPDGKDELAEEAIERAGHTVAERVRQGLDTGEDVAAAVHMLVQTIAHFVEVSAFHSGGPLMTVAMETATTNDRLNRACCSAYQRVQQAFEAALVAHGFVQTRAQELATFSVAAIEGGVILSRTYHTGDPLRVIARQLEWLVRTTPRS